MLEKAYGRACTICYMPITGSSSPIGKQGVCHLLADAGRGRPERLPRDESVIWSVAMARHVAENIESPSMDPVEDLQDYLVAFGLPGAGRCNLPGEPCDQCVASLMLPMYVAPAVVELAILLGADPAVAFQWASRIGAIVLSSPSTDRARTPTDALAAYLMSEYKASRPLTCDLTEAGAA